MRKSNCCDAGVVLVQENWTAMCLDCQEWCDTYEEDNK